MGEKERCKYCLPRDIEGMMFPPMFIGVTVKDFDVVNVGIGVCIDANRLVIKADIGDASLDCTGGEINYCPMCGRKLV